MFSVSPNSYGLGAAIGLDAGAQMPRVVPAGAAAAHGTEQIAQRPIAEEVERLVGDLELDRAGVLAHAAAGAAPMLALGLEIRRAGDEALFHHALDDLLDEIFELLPRLFLIAVGRFAEQLLHRLFRQHAAAEQRLENRVVQRLHRPVVVAVGGSPHGLLNPLESSRSDSFDTRSSRSISSSRSPVYFV